MKAGIGEKPILIVHDKFVIICYQIKFLVIYWHETKLSFKVYILYCPLLKLWNHLFYHSSTLFIWTQSISYLISGNVSKNKLHKVFHVEAHNF